MEKYIKFVKEQWSYHKIHERIENVSKNAPSSITPEYTTTINRLDDQISQILNAAEKKCSKVPRTATDAWSPELHEAIQHIWECRYTTRDLQRTSVTIPHFSEINFSDAKEALNQAQIKYRDIKKRAKDERQKHLKSRAEYYAKSKTTKHIAQKLKQLQTIEKQRTCAARINVALNRNINAGINGILIPDITAYPE